MQWGKRFATGALAMVMGASATGLITAAPAEAAGAKYKCKAYAKLDGLGRPTAYSTCSKSSGGKAVRLHRVEIKCDQVQGAREHVVTYTLHGPWVSAGKKSNVKCGFKNYLRGFSVQTKR
ncbi:hypothetical protein NLX86_21155 [Streptomyces sp. A3M-1-3]|uniref:hypothetical protein n=1 Tax=Streptomyces sp. A3M-1-3 TaxID=2962044 RepID=UPI0020B803BE|nr:hypothetical protein [Streptomyces sp. A3M-1-3]MCP3820509.1 hypothetical protein [Streptomyces sp. A3M-1-3]